MNRLILRLATAPLVGAWCLGSAAQAQLVDVEPGFVKAPFVRVYTNPDGSSYVLLVFSPGYGSGYNADGNWLAGRGDIAQMDWRTLRQTIRNSSVNLDDRLDAISTGASWQVYLKTAEIRQRIAEGDGPPSKDARQTLQAIHRAFDTTQNTPAFAMISNLSSFQTLDAALGEFLMSPEDRLRRRLLADADQLQRSIDRAGLEDAWHNYLALPQTFAMPWPSAEPQPVANPAELATAIQHFDLVAKSDKFGMVAGLPGFQATHKDLADYQTLVTSPPNAQKPPEELPAPKPTE